MTMPINLGPFMRPVRFSGWPVVGRFLVYKFDDYNGEYNDVEVSLRMIMSQPMPCELARLTGTRSGQSIIKNGLLGDTTLYVQDLGYQEVDYVYPGPWIDGEPVTFECLG
jgi:hypothetical protein